MRTGRKWAFVTAGIAALSLGADAAAQKHAQPFPKMHDLRPSWAGAEFRGPGPGVVPGANAGSSLRGPVAPSIPVQSGGRASPAPAFKDPGQEGTVPTANQGDARGASNNSGPPGGNMPDKSNKGEGGGHGSSSGKDQSDSPGESIQASTGELQRAIPKGKALHEVPTCR
jgi:hypothetical protein